MFTVKALSLEIVFDESFLVALVVYSGFSARYEMDSMTDHDRQSLSSILRREGYLFDNQVLDFNQVTAVLALLLMEMGYPYKITRVETLGEKVKVAEDMLLLLRKAGLRLDLHPHQLSGLDWKALKGLFSWTISRSNEKRTEILLTNNVPSYAEMRQKLKPKVQKVEVDDAAQQYPILSDLILPTESNIITSGMLSKLQERHARLTKEVQASEMQLKQQTDSLTSAREALNQSKTDSSGSFNILLKLIQDHEQLKSYEKDFKRTCKNELSNMETSIEFFERTNSELETAMNSLSQILDKLEERLYQLRVDVAPVSRIEAAIARSMDERPTKDELFHYENRFSELYEEMTLNSEEHKRLVASLNHSLHSAKLLTDQIELLRSIRDGFQKSRSSIVASKEFESQFKSTVDHFQQSLKKSLEKLEASRKRRDEAVERSLHLTFKQREYYRAVNELHQAFVEQERLMQQISKKA